MKCWECKKKIDHCHRVFYSDEYQEKGRDVCDDCYPKLKFTNNYVRVKRIMGRQLGVKYYNENVRNSEK
jgi:hypothetical protein